MIFYYLFTQVYYVSSDQAYAVMGISKVIQRQEPKICIIEGPPGEVLNFEKGMTLFESLLYAYILNRYRKNNSVD